MKKYILLLLPALLLLRAQGQNAIFLSHGKIEFEKKLNQYSLYQDEDEGWNDLMKKSTAQFKTTYFDLLFKDNKTLYRPGRENIDKSGLQVMDLPADNNIIWADIENQKEISQKKVFEEVFLIQDSLRHIKWKITDETRTIAGFSCRRANAIIMDSIYVVAFYTDEILTSGGPESFSGLPGMILGVALPHQHVTWFATKVEAINVSDNELIAPVKGKKVSNAVLLQTVQESLKQWGKWGRTYIQSVML